MAEGSKNVEDEQNMDKYVVALLCLFCFCCWWWLLLSSQPHLMLWHPKPKESFAYSGDVRYHSWHARCKVKFIDFGPKINFPQAFQLKEVRGEWLLQCFIFFFAVDWYLALNLPAPKTSLNSEFFALIWSVIEPVSVAGTGLGPELSNGIDCSGQLSLFKTKSAQIPLARHCTGNWWHQLQLKKKSLLSLLVFFKKWKSKKWSEFQIFIFFGQW